MIAVKWCWCWFDDDDDDDHDYNDDGQDIDAWSLKIMQMVEVMISAYNWRFRKYYIPS